MRHPLAPAILLLSSCANTENAVDHIDTGTECDVAEIAYDGIDNDCDPSTPDDDLDGDGALLAIDCNDDDSAILPGADELCDGIDNDCDDEIDEDAVDALTWYADADADGYGDSNSPADACEVPSGHVADDTDCDDTLDSVHPLGEEVCNSIDDDCDVDIDEALSCLSFGGHRVEKDGDYYYALYDDDGFGIIGTSEWYGASDGADSPEGVTWNEDFTILYYNDLYGRVFSQTEPFSTASTLVGTFGLGQVGGGVLHDGHYYVGDYENGDIYQMDISTGATSQYASLGGSACKPYFGNSTMAIDTDGSIYASSSCGIVRYTPGSSATQLNMFTGLISAVAMNADQELFSLDYDGYVVQFDKSTGKVLYSVQISHAPYTTWTLAIDASDNILVNYWGEQRLFSLKDGSLVESWSSSSYYPGSSGAYWYVTF